MSRKSTGGQGNVTPDFDACFTPDAVVDVCCQLADVAGLEPGARVLEPSAGDGQYVRGLARVRTDLDVHAVEIQQQHEPALTAALEPFDGRDVRIGRYDRLLRRLGVDLVIGNPPYTVAEAFVRRSLHHLADGGVLAFLLRLGFYGTAGRRALYQQRNLAAVLVLEERVTFYADATDQAEYALFVWQRGYQGTPMLDRVSRKPGLLQQDVARILPALRAKLS